MTEGCVHHWMLGTQTATGTPGRCKRCHEVRVFGGGEVSQLAAARAYRQRGPNSSKSKPLLATGGTPQ